jgi:hypothetical protein
MPGSTTNSASLERAGKQSRAGSQQAAYDTLSAAVQDGGDHAAQ